MNLTAWLPAWKRSEAHDELDDVAILQSERTAKVVLRDDFEDVRMVRADRHDHRAVHVTDRREEALRAAERPPGGFKARDLDAGALLEDLQFREIRARDLEVPCAFVRLEPELLAELVLVSLLPHVEGALAQAARDGPGDRHRYFDREYPLLVRVLLPDDLPAARRQSDPLAAGREVSGDQTLPDKLEDSLGCALLAHADELAELPRRQVHVLFRPAEEGDRLQRLDVIRLQPRGGGPARAYSFPRVTILRRRDDCGIGGRLAECRRLLVGPTAAGRSSRRRLGVPLRGPGARRPRNRDLRQVDISSRASARPARSDPGPPRGRVRP